jgi:hypothetical protein
MPKLYVQNAGLLGLTLYAQAAHAYAHANGSPSVPKKQ